jgi:hypothetical protein
VVITGLDTAGEGDTCLRTCAFEQFRAKLLRQERIGIAAVDQKIGKFGAVLDQRDCIMLAPYFTAPAPQGDGICNVDRSRLGRWFVSHRVGISDQAAFAVDFATWVAIASIRAGDRQS